ncbi:hypothetical protein F5X96DRAFT_669733 [Biscogniauxia mediterranea]|nr:hypothetical protein F5X96DRAFT_669733 [Biscogniauxia mediterranea]
MQPPQPGPSTNAGADASAADAAARTPSKVPLMGVFRNGIWYCNCRPRLPAHQFTVKRDTENRGRTFYTCQHERGKENKCDFWLWAEDARPREINALLSNSRSEYGTPSRRGTLKQMTLHESITPRKEKRHWTEKTPISGAAELAELGIARGETAPHSDNHGSDSSPSREQENEAARPSNVKPEINAARSQEAVCAGSKRKRLEEDDEYGGDFSSGEEDELVALTDSSTRYHDAFATPAVATRSTAVDDGIPTPLTERPTRRVLFAVPEDSSAKRQRTNDEPSSSSSSFPTSSSSSRSSSSPSSSQQHASANPAATPGTEAANLTKEVMTLLRDQKLDEPVLRAVRAALDRHAAKARGLERGRDASREAVKRAEDRAAQLQRRVAELEEARALDAEVRKKTRIDLMKLYLES